MTTSPMRTETYTVTYVAEIPHIVTIQAPSGLSADQVEQLVTNEDLSMGEMGIDCWDYIKEAEPRSVTTEAGNQMWFD